MYTLTKKFHELTTNELYDILQLRNQCFIVEQKVPYQDLDNHDKEGYHILLYDTWDNLVAYVRAINPGVRFKEANLTVHAPRSSGSQPEVLHSG